MGVEEGHKEEDGEGGIVDRQTAGREGINLF